MPVQLDIAGNFATGQQAMIDRRRARQLERARDYELAGAADIYQARREAVNRFRQNQGLDPYEFAPLETNQDPWFSRLRDWWKERRATRLMPSQMLPEQEQSVQDEMNAVMGDEAQTFPLAETGPIYETEMYPRTGKDVVRNGGLKRRAIPRYADGGGVGEQEMARRRRAAEFRREGINTRTAQTGRGGAIPREGILRRTTNALRGRGVSAAGRARAVKGGALAAGAAVLPQLAEDYDQRIDKRFGWGDSASQEGEGDPSLGGFARYFGRRALGYASDLADVMTFGAASNLYRDQQAIPGEEGPGKQAAKGPPPGESPPTPDAAIAQAAIKDGSRMAEEARQRSAPPGEIDFSQVDFDANELPSMGVKDWVDYRQSAIQDLLMRGMSEREAYEQGMQSVTTLQQQGFVDYAQQALMHLQGGNPRAAANALRAAYQYFPNGSDVKIGVQQGQDGQPVLIGVGVDEQTGQPKGQPMILNDERLAVMIENFSNPEAFRSWTKDWRDEAFDRRKFEEVEKPEAESNARYRDRAGRAALINAEADRVRAGREGAGARRQVDLDRANAAFTDAVELLGYEDEAEADQLMSLMSQIYARSSWQYPEVIDFVRKAKREGRLPEVMEALGLGTPEE